MASRSTGKRRLIRYTETKTTYVVEEESFCSNNSDFDDCSNVSHVRDGNVSSKKKRSRSKELVLVDEIHQEREDASAAKQVVRKKKNAKTISNEVIEPSQNTHKEKSDSNSFSTKKSKVSSKTTESSNKDTRLKKRHSDSNQNTVIIKSIKRKDTDSREAAKKIKLDDQNVDEDSTDDVQFISNVIDSIIIDSDNFSEPETSLRNQNEKTKKKKSSANIKTENESSVGVKKVEEHESSKKSKRQKFPKPTEELQLAEANDQMKSEALHGVEINSPSTGVSKAKKEKKSEKIEPAKKSKSEDELTTDLNIVQTEKELDIHSTSRNEPVEEEEKTQGKLGTHEWEVEMLSYLTDLDLKIAKNIIVLFENDNTIPFIARYRRELTENIDVDKLRRVKCTYEYIKSLEKKAISALNKLKAAGQLTESLKNSIYHVQSIEELNYIYAPYKQSFRPRAEKARNLGLEQAAFQVLNGTGEFNPAIYVNSDAEGIKDTKQVLLSVQHILTEIFSKDGAVLEFILKTESKIPITVQSTKRKTDDAVEDEDGKFRLYYEFSRLVSDLHSHQILALNRGENLKILTVKMIVSETFFNELYKFCFAKWLKHGKNYPLRSTMFEKSLKECYSRQIVPILIRRTKAKLTREAQSIAIENFALNLKNLLQTQPVKGCPILGIDPGFRHGVKFAIISSQGDVLWTSVLYFHFRNRSNSSTNQQNMNEIKERMVEYRCEIIAIGNGCGSRNIEAIISHKIKNDFFNPLNVTYTIVNERGASIYSCSSVAKEEFPDLDPNLISAVFIARTLQNPMNEYVKVEPKHLGVGMYQHDIPEVRLNQSLNEVVQECVSFSGIDLNTASIHILKKIAGLGDTRAANIIKWRKEKGPFRNRHQLLEVDKIGPKTFEQCSGFLRIHANTCNVRIEDVNKKGIPKNNDYNPLDSTWIHPESYNVAYLFMGHCDCRVADLGSSTFIGRIKRIVRLKGIETISEILGEKYDTISFIYDALTKPSDFDYRNEFAKPVFRKGLSSLKNLNVGDILQGIITTVAQFGAFVDIGVGKDGLIHFSKFNSLKPKVGDKVNVEILSVEPQTGRIKLFLVKIE